MSGYMKKIYNIIYVIIGTALVSACIPSGVRDTRIDRPVNEPRLETDNVVTTRQPDWSPSSVNRNARAAQDGEYIVRSGDTLSGIAAKTGAPQNAIAENNDLSEPFALRIGQKLQIPSGVYHRVNSGETGIAIARAYGVSWNEIVDLNNLEAPYILRVGQRLRLPNAGQDIVANNTELTLEQRASSFNLEIDDIVTGGEPAIAAKDDKDEVSLVSTISKPEQFNSQFTYPLRGRLLSRFGSKGGGIVNDGINIAGSEGASIGAAADGVVVYSGNEIEIFGGLILIDHGGGWVTAYGHVRSINVERGEKVATGQNIGEVGQTGYVDRPQLHFEIRKDRKPIDPLTKLPNS